jgi:pimeloyl-ACP methyl ester carboxylesterase
MELTIVELWKKTEANASVAILPGAGHCANMDVPDLFNRTLHQFFTNGSL